MIKYLTHNDLDVEKYDNCIAKSINSRIYACSWYLDCVTDKWDVLVLNDYEAVMPLPKRKKYGLHYIYQAPWIQQLGIFSKNDIDEQLIKDFVSAIPKRFVLVDYLFNSENIFSSTYLTKRINFVLKLNTSFKEITQAYNKNRKRVIKQDFSNFVIDKKGRKTDFLDLYQHQKVSYKTHNDSFEKLQNILDCDTKVIHIWNVYINKEIVAGLVWLKDANRITYLLPVAANQAKKKNIPTFIINELIKEYQHSNFILDFEGSMIQGVAKFYKSFGATKEEYFWYQKRFGI